MDMREQLKEAKKQQIESNKQFIIGELRSTNRDGIEDLIKYLENDTDFFVAPASAKFHNNCEGGLAMHSMNVRELLIKKNDEFKLGLSLASINITSLTHDLCKANFYKNSMRLRKDKNNKWEAYGTYEIDEKVPLGHGEKSVMILQQFIRLSLEESLMIRWHMGLGVPKENYKDLDNAIELYPSVLAISTADHESSRFKEEVYEPEIFTMDEYNALMKEK